MVHSKIQSRPIAIHHRHGSFSEKWIEYCENQGIPYKLVDCYRNDILEQIDDCFALMWHWSHHDAKAALFARQLTYSVEKSGKIMFPNFATVWHFNDKVGQKYIFEAMSLPAVNSYVFYDKVEAVKWASETDYPKVFKLKGGAGAQNVRLVRSFRQAERLISVAFGKGFRPVSRQHFLSERVWKFQCEKKIGTFIGLFRGLLRVFFKSRVEKEFPRETNYIYFQDFIHGNDSDIRVIVVGRRAFGVKRLVRENDFRASGSNKIIYNPEEIPADCLRIAFSVSRELKTQCLAFDFVLNKGRPLIVEISYGFASRYYSSCPGFWTDELQWVEGPFVPEIFMVKDLIAHNRECS